MNQTMNNINAESKRNEDREDAFVKALLAVALGSGLLQQPSGSSQGTEVPAASQPPGAKSPEDIGSEMLNDAIDAYEGVTTLMREVLERMINLDAHLKPEDVKRRYGDKDHPYASRNDWREHVADEETDLGYWEWIVFRLNQHAEEFKRQDADQDSACDCPVCATEA